ncbi:MAG: hypothetical protein M1825_005709 [Sarcosagium campestre]|nr:MAG: hypothetical protein M1825_005709 [Sarcosagium campestre]
MDPQAIRKSSTSSESSNTSTTSDKFSDASSIATSKIGTHRAEPLLEKISQVEVKHHQQPKQERRTQPWKAMIHEIYDEHRGLDGPARGIRWV